MNFIKKILFINYNIMNNNNKEKVLLPYVQIHKEKSINLEPQSVRNKPHNLNNIYIDSDKGQGVTNNFITANVPLCEDLTMLSVDSLDYELNIPNVNIRNNQINFYSSNTGGIGGTLHNVTIPEGFYLTTTDLMDAIRDALNTVTGATGLTFSYTFSANSENLYGTLTSAGGSYNIDTSNVYFTKQKYLWGPPNDNVLSTNKDFGQVLRYYTRYFTIYSNIVNQYTKNPNSTNEQGNANIVVRTYLQPGPQSQFFTIINKAWRAYVPEEQLYNIDLELRDEFNERLYLSHENLYYELILSALI